MNYIKIKEKIENKRNCNHFFWKITIFIKDFIWFFFIFIPIKILNFIDQNFLPDILSVYINYCLIFKKKLNLKNPQTFNEKLHWKKLYDKKEIYTICSDKDEARNFVEKKIGGRYLIPLIFKTNNPEQIDFSNLKKPYVIKSNHASEQILFVFKDDKIIKKNIIKQCKKWLNCKYSKINREWPYKNITPKILIEEMLLDENNKIPTDYKFHCFGGKVEMIQVDIGRFNVHKRSFFDKNWELLPFQFCPEKNKKPEYKVEKNIKEPKNLGDMIKISEKLSENFDYVRIDLYNISGKIYFGEFTFFHGAGYEKFFPEKYDLYFGNILKINNEKQS
jgi:hypothetical protein